MTHNLYEVQRGGGAYQYILVYAEDEEHAKRYAKSCFINCGDEMDFEIEPEPEEPTLMMEKGQLISDIYSY